MLRRGPVLGDHSAGYQLRSQNLLFVAEKRAGGADAALRMTDNEEKIKHNLYSYHVGRRVVAAARLEAAVGIAERHRARAAAAPVAGGAAGGGTTGG